MTHWRRTTCTFASVLIMLSTAPAPVRAQDESVLAKNTQNPVTDLISVLFQNSSFGVGPKDDVEVQYILNIQPAIPFRLTDEWNVITRTIAPLIYDVELTPGVGEVFGLGDMLSTDLRILGERLQPDDAEGAAIRDESGSVIQPATGEPAELEHYDPWEGFNGKMFEFNRRIDKYGLKPVAKGWKTVVPEQAQIMISNVFENFNVVPRVVNNLLQGKWKGAERELSRFLINSTAGIGGLFDPATDVWHITKSPADFGQTLGKWGAGPGPYLVLPFMEPLTVRDGIGKIIDRAMDPLTYVIPLVPALSLTLGNRVNERALNYELFVGFDDGVIDAYTAVRDVYLQRRERVLND
jgi:phospholipid-binding lipoprotein MlaA